MLYNVNMFTNGRSIYLIATSDEKRQAIWQHVFGTGTLPVLAAKPRWQAMQGREFDVLAFDLALSELSGPQRQRFAGYLSRKYQMDYALVLNELETAVSWPIPAGTDIVVLEPAEQVSPLALLLSGRGHRKRQFAGSPRLAAVSRRP